MADHGHSHNPDGSCPSGREEDKIINQEALQSNMMGINYVRSLMAIIAGVIAGIAGLTGSKGFLLYIVCHLITSFALLAKMNFKVSEYLTPGSSVFWFAIDGLTGQGLSFVMFWTLSFAMVHIF
jgi:hypothetical protein